MCEHKFLNSFGVEILRNEISGSCCKCMFNFIRNDQTVFQHSCAILHVQPQGMEVPVDLHLHQYLVLSGFLILAILISMRYYHIMVIICIFLVTNDVEHLSYAYLPLIFSLVKCLLRSFAHFTNWVISFLIVEF